MKGGKAKATDGMSRVYHYEVTGASRIDYCYNAEYTTSSDGDAHPVVRIVSIDLGSHLTSRDTRGMRKLQLIWRTICRAAGRGAETGER